MKTKTILPLAALTALLLAACQTDDRRLDLSGTIDAEVDSASARHAIENEQLRKVMWELLLAPANRLPQELDTDREQKWRQDDAVRILGQMARSAERIPDVLKHTDLVESQKERFRELAANLKSATLRLQTDVPTLGADEIGRRFDALQDQCIACHRKFRVLPTLE